MTTTAWSELARLLSDDPEVASATTRAVEDPAGYLAEHEESLGQRGIEDAEEVTGAIALVDALAEAGDLAYLDWKASPEEVAGQLGALERIRDAGVDLDPVGGLDVEVEVAAGAANHLLSEEGLYVLILDEDSDAYPLVVVPAARVSDILTAAAAAGAEIRVPVAPNN